MSFIRVLCWLACLAVLSPSSAAAAEQQWSPQALREDLQAMDDVIRRTHPELGHSVDAAALSVAIDNLRQRLDRPMTRDEAWKEFAVLNPLFADSHLFVGFPDWRGDTAKHLASGGRLFPFEVHVDADGQPYVKSLLGGAPTAWAGARIERINGVDARSVAAPLLERMHGDTRAFRGRLLSRRWWFFHWKMHGAQPVYELVLSKNGPVRATLAGSAEVPSLLADEATFDRTFRFEMLPGKAAVLTVGSFSWDDEAEYFRFTKNAFERMRAAGIRTLVIDIRDNGGGDDRYWKEGLLPEIATGPYVWGSTFRKRVLEKYRDEGETVGEIVSGALAPEDAVRPLRDSQNRFGGKTYVLVGASTYSSAILFANVMQDYGFGTIAGTGGAARSRQSGGVERYALPNTGLAVWVPRFVLDRPKRTDPKALLEPDIVLEDNPFQPRDAIDDLLMRLEERP